MARVGARRIPRTELLYIVQGHYGAYGWEDVAAESTHAEARARLREYNENERGYAHRLIRRREPIAGRARTRLRPAKRRRKGILASLTRTRRR